MATRAALLDQAADLEPRTARWRMGLIALATDHTTEPDFAALSPSEELAVHVNRVAFSNPANRESLMAMQSLLTRAAELILPGEMLDALAYSCTAASALIGDAAVRDAIQAAKPRVPAVTSNQAMFWHAMRQAGCALAVSGFGRLLEAH